MASHDALFDVPDATDWNNTLLSGFVAVESPMRCQVCKEFIKTPMITSCGHTFCSECIRRSLSHNGECPACRAKDQELKLRPNKAMEEVVEAFQRTRAAALEVARAQPSEERSPKRRKRDVSSRERSLEPAMKTRTSDRRASRPAPQAPLDDLTVESDEDYTPGMLCAAQLGDDWCLTAADDGRVPCPVCGERMKEAAVNKHMDDIHFNPAPKPRQLTTLSSFAPVQGGSARPVPEFKPQPLPTISYNLLKDKALRDKLHALGIPSHGAKPLMERRHREWMTLWNANCDATHPKSKRELLKQLDEWERTQAYPAVQRGTKENQVANKEFDGKRWANQHANEFDSLVGKARKQVAERRAKEKAAAEEAAIEAQGAHAPAEPQRIEVSAMRMSQEIYVDGNMSPPESQAQPEKVSAQQQNNEGTSADVSSIPKEQPQSETELDPNAWWMKELINGANDRGNTQPQNQSFQSFVEAQGAPQHQYQQPQAPDHQWNSNQIQRDDDDIWASGGFAPQVYAAQDNIDPALNGQSGFDFEAFLAQPTQHDDLLNGQPQSSRIPSTQAQEPLDSSYKPPSAQLLPSQQQYQQQRHNQQPSPQQYQAPHSQSRSLCQTISPSPAYTSPDQQQPPSSGQQPQTQSHWQTDANGSLQGPYIPNNDSGLQRMLQHGDMRNRDGTQMTAQQRLEILKRPYKRTKDWE